MRKPSALALAAAVAMTLAACGDDDDSATSADTTAEAIGVQVVEDATTDFNEADVTFAQGMISHHEQAVEMADTALDPTVGAGSDVVDLATRIKAAQDPEIELMTGWLTTWGQPLQMHTSNGHSMESMEGMMTVEDMDALAALTGAAFDQRWIEMMIAHHQGAIAMAETVQAGGSNADVIALAGQIITAQQGEIDEMQPLLGG